MVALSEKLPGEVEVPRDLVPAWHCSGMCSECGSATLLDLDAQVKHTLACFSIGDGKWKATVATAHDIFFAVRPVPRARPGCCLMEQLAAELWTVYRISDATSAGGG